jgi:hypothetical protein
MASSARRPKMCLGGLVSLSSIFLHPLIHWFTMSDVRAIVDEKSTLKAVVTRVYASSEHLMMGPSTPRHM